MSRHSQSDSSYRHPPQPAGGGQSDDDTVVATPSSSSRINNSNQESLPTRSPDVGFSSPLTLRIRGSGGRPLFPIPATTLPLRMHDNQQTANAVQTNSQGSSVDEEASKEKQTPRFNSIVEMIEAHIEELKKRPPLGTPKSTGEDRMNVDGESQQQGSSGGGSATSK